MDAFRFSRIGISEELICNDLHIVVLGFVLKIFSINFIKEIIILIYDFNFYIKYIFRFNNLRNK